MIEDLEKWVGKNCNDIIFCDNPISPIYDWRIVRPNSLITLDYKENRINIYVDENNIIIKFSIG